MFTQGARRIPQIVSLKIGNIQANVSQVAIDELLQQEEGARDSFSDMHPFHSKIVSLIVKAYHILLKMVVMEGIKMKRKLMSVTFGIPATFVCLVLAFPICVSASDVPYIAFTSMRTGDNDIYMMEINGKDLQNLTNHLANDFSPAFSPDGQWMAYVSNRDGKSGIYLMDLTTKESRRLTMLQSANKEPEWSPDGESIVFVSNRANRANQYDVYTMNVNSKEIQQLTNEGDNYNPTWSLDGQSIAFSSKRNGEPFSVYVMTADGRRQRKLTQGSNPTWSPDGKQIAYTLGIAGNGVYVMSAEGQNSRRLTPENIWSDKPTWSPDGQWIAYEAELDPWGNPNIDPDANIYLVNPAGAKTRQLTRHPARDRYPAWVPAGFLSVSTTAETQTTLWGKLKQPIGD